MWPVLRCSGCAGGVHVIQGKKRPDTGSSRGIGRGIALKLAEKGGRIAIHYYRNRDAAQATLEKIQDLGSSGFLVQADVCQPEEVRKIFQKVRSEFGSLDIFVSNARTEAPTFYQAPMEITLEQWETAIDSQAKAFLIAVQESVPLMTEGGRIIAITFAPGGRFGSWQPWVAMGRRRLRWKYRGPEGGSMSSGYSSSTWYHSNRYCAQAACAHCGGVVRHETCVSALVRLCITHTR